MIRLIGIVVSLMLMSTAVGAAVYQGCVLSEDGQPLEGATIRLSDGTATDTDEDGRFRIEADAGLAISVTHVGYREVTGLKVVNGDYTFEMAPSMSVLDKIVVTGTRYEKAAYKVSQPITTAAAEQISEGGYTIVSDVIRNFPGVDMNDAGSFRARPVIRGLFGTRILVLVDGERLNDQRDISSFAGVSMSLVDPNEIERVEVVNGPSSVLYGSDAMGGVINILTRSTRFTDEARPWARYSGRYTSADQQHANRLDVGFTGKRLSGSFGVMYREADESFAGPDGWNERPEYGQFRPEFYDSLNAATGRNFSRDRLVNTGSRVNNYDGRLAYKLSDKYRLDLRAGAFRGNDIGYPGVPNDSTPYFFFYPYHNRDNVSLALTGKALSDKLSKLNVRAYYQKIEKEFLTDFLRWKPSPYAPITLIDNLNHTEVKKYGLTFQELYRVHDSGRLTFGFDYLREEIDGHSVTRTEIEAGPAVIRDFDPGTEKQLERVRGLCLRRGGSRPVAVDHGAAAGQFLDQHRADRYLCR